ncbi:hypothetical protein DRJ25_00010 [Candidatus Woesearchaeota archaeon]|nr:MAG: hypothetical protein DRJ25_00010 [Candidatus Woesearchaeota archaeon]
MRAQVTLFIIIGLVMLIAVGITLYATSFFITKPRLVKVDISGFVVGCLKQASESSFKLFGLNAGFVSRENVRALTAPDGREFVVLESTPSHDVGCNGGVCWYYHLPPKYPWVYFPFKPGSNEVVFNGYFGDSNLLSFEEAKSRLENDIVRKLKSCVNNFDSFRRLGIVVSPLSEPVVSVLTQNFSFINQERFTTVKLKWPLKSSVASSKLVTDSFSVKLPVRLSSVYYSVEQMVNKDISDISYVPFVDGLDIDVIRFNGFSVINVTDHLSSVFGKDFGFVFARENRDPALWFVKIPESDLEFHVVFKDDGSEIPTKIKVEGNKLIFDDPCPGEQNLVINLNASDPDEDVLAFSADPEELFIKDNGGDVKIQVSDGNGGGDFQVLKNVHVVGCVRR